jgi:hypothetical protein
MFLTVKTHPLAHMHYSKIAQNLRPTLQCFRQDVRDYLHKRFRSPSLLLDSIEKKALEDLERDGYTVIKDFWTRERAFQMRDKLEGYLTIGGNKDFEGGAYMRFRDNTGSDDGVRRIYHVDKLLPELAEFRENRLIDRVAEAYYGFKFYSGSLVFQHNLQTTINTRFHHVDWFGKQFKPFLYLDDVDEGNGPFTYIRGTHRSHLIRLKKQLFGNATGSPTSFYEDDVKSVIASEIQICGKAGTLILADVRGLHRGSPQKNRSRSILVNYMYPTQGDVFMDK